MPPTNSNTPDFSAQRTLMVFLCFPDSYGNSHSFLAFHEDLQKMLRALAPWHLALLGFKASVSLLWNDRALQQHQADAALRLLPPDLWKLAEKLAFSRPEDLQKAQEVGFPWDAWNWLFLQDPFNQRQDDGSSEAARSEQSATLSPDPEVANESRQTDCPSSDIA